jgi:hypothetical protein
MAVAAEITGLTQFFSIMGISYEALESTNDGNRYPNYPVALLQQGIINTIAYSLWLDDLCTASFDFIFSTPANMLLQPRALGASSSVVLILPNSVAFLRSLISRMSRWDTFTSP